MFGVAVGAGARMVLPLCSFYQALGLLRPLLMGQELHKAHLAFLCLKVKLVQGVFIAAVP